MEHCVMLITLEKGRYQIVNCNNYNKQQQNRAVVKRKNKRFKTTVRYSNLVLNDLQVIEFCSVTNTFLCVSLCVYMHLHPDCLSTRWCLKSEWSCLVPTPIASSWINCGYEERTVGTGGVLMVTTGHHHEVQKSTTTCY